MLGDAIAVLVAVLLSLWTWSITAGFPFDVGFVRAHAVWLLAVPVWLLLLATTREAAVVLDLRQTAAALARAAVTALVIYLAVFFYDGGDRLPRLVAVYILWDAALLVSAWRVIALWSLTQAPFSRRILVVGSGQALHTAFDLLQAPNFRDAEILGVATTDRDARWHVVGTPADVDQLARRLEVTDLVVALDGDVDEQWVQRLLRCQESGTHAVGLAQLYEETLGRVPVGHVGPSWLITSFFDVARFRDASPLAKRLFDMSAAAVLSVGAIVAAPLLAAAIVIDSGRPVLYRQERLGRAGRPFQLIKFRTMRPDAEFDGQPQWSAPNDARVTRVGRLLRRTHLDELPNLIAVLKGEMSMVGPRPERAQFVQRLEREVPLYRARLTVVPGLTGWAQVNWAYGDSVEDATVKLEYDLYYIKHRSVWFDAVILVKTIGTVLRLRGQ